MCSAVQTQPLCATWPKDRGRIPSAAASRRNVALSPSILQAGESREHQGYPKVGYAGSPGLLCGARRQPLLSGCCHPAGTPALQDVPQLPTAPAGCWWLLAEGQQRNLGAAGRALLPVTGHPRGRLLFGSNCTGSAAQPVPKGLTSNFLC